MKLTLYCVLYDLNNLSKVVKARDHSMFLKTNIQLM